MADTGRQEFTYADYQESLRRPTGQPAGLFSRGSSPPDAPPGPPPDTSPGLETGPTCGLCNRPARDVETLIGHLTTAHKGMEVPCPYCDRTFKSRSLRMHVISCRSNPHRSKRTRRSPGQPAPDPEPAATTPEPQEAPAPPPPPTLPPAPPPAAERLPLPATTPPAATVAAPAVVTLLSGLLAGTGTEAIPVRMLPDVLAWAEATQALRDNLIAAQLSALVNSPNPAANTNGARQP